MYFHMRAVRHVYSVLTEDMAVALTIALVQSRLDYSVLFKTSTSSIKKPQRAQTRWHCCSPKSPVFFSCISPTLLTLATGYVMHQIQIGNTYKSRSVAQPTYLLLLLQQYQPTRFLQSGSQNLLALPTVSSEFGRHAFSYCAPSVWIELLLSVRSLYSFNSFKSYLKTHLLCSSLMSTVLLPPSDRQREIQALCVTIVCIIKCLYVCMYVCKRIFQV